MTPEPHRDKPEDGAQFARRIDRESSVLYMDYLFSVPAGSDETEGALWSDGDGRAQRSRALASPLPHR